MQQALEQWRVTDKHLNPEDVACPPPLLYEHVNVLGRYDFTLPEAVAAGHLRPLRTLTASLSNRLGDIFCSYLMCYPFSTRCLINCQT